MKVAVLLLLLGVFYVVDRILESDWVVWLVMLLGLALLIGWLVVMWSSWLGRLVLAFMLIEEVLTCGATGCWRCGRR